MAITVCTTVCNLNLRKGAGTSFPVVSELKPREQLDVIEDTGEWLKVIADGKEGFVNRKFVCVQRQPFADGFLAHQPEIKELPLAPERPWPVISGAEMNLKLIITAWNRFGGLVSQLAEKIGIEPAAAMAVVAAESACNGFQDNRMIIRFENHFFWQVWGCFHPREYGEHFSFSKTKPWTGQRFRISADSTWQSFHGNQAAEWRVFNLASSLDQAGAQLSTSMGLSQIMGANHALIGYESVADMYAAFSEGETAQLVGLFDFIKGPHSHSSALSALQIKDFIAFAACYNGCGQAAAYAANLQKFYELTASLLKTMHSRF